jgi:NTP pyrophosphatase (non-canonical NTP hydrolase)
MHTITDMQLSNHKELTALVRTENERQVSKWGIQTRTPAEWLMYTTEELGELAEAIAEHQYRGGSTADVVKEAIQVATLSLKIAEMYAFNNMKAQLQGESELIPNSRGRDKEGAC